MTFNSFAICGPGRVRAENQDNLYINGKYRENVADKSVFRYGNISNDGGLYAVADGMGGEQHGELASLIAVQEMRNADFTEGLPGMTRYLIERNADICDLMLRNGGMRSGTTFAGLYIRSTGTDDPNVGGVDAGADNAVVPIANVINIGDSRVYLLRDGLLTQISYDHTSVRQMIELGAITIEAARSHPSRHKLTQHLGIFPDEMVIEPYTVSFPIEKNDLFLLCSDGLTDMLEDYEIQGILNSSAFVEKMAGALFNTAMQNGGKDNITILIVQTADDINETQPTIITPAGGMEEAPEPIDELPPHQGSEVSPSGIATANPPRKGAVLGGDVMDDPAERAKEYPVKYVTLKQTAFTGKKKTFPAAALLVAVVVIALLAVVFVWQRTALMSLIHPEVSAESTQTEPTAAPEPETALSPLRSSVGRITNAPPEH